MNLVIPEPSIPIDPALRTQLAYYEARASEYDAWWKREGRYDRGPEATAAWFQEAALLEQALDAFQPRGRILELACGTGLWSRKLLPHADSLTVIDGSAEMLKICAARLQSPSVNYLQADLFDWQPAATFDTVFFSFWLSHVPPEKFEAFMSMVRKCLAPGGRIFFIDSRHEPASTANDHQLPPPEAGVLTRRLDDGREFQIYKVFYELPALKDRLATLGWNVDAWNTPRFFLYGAGHRME